MNLADRMAGIDTNLDDLQSGVEACTRATHTIQGDATAVDQQVSKLIEHADLIDPLITRAREVHACALHQSDALQELRQNLSLLRAELNLPTASNTSQRRIGARDRRKRSENAGSTPVPSRKQEGT